MDLDHPGIVNTQVVIIIVGSFNIDAQLNLDAVSFMKMKFNLDNLPFETPMTLGGTITDLNLLTDSLYNDFILKMLKLIRI